MSTHDQVTITRGEITRAQAIVEISRLRPGESFSYVLDGKRYTATPRQTRKLPA